MAITRAQQYRQMLKDGNFVMQGGVRNYLGEQKIVSDVPVKWQSGSDKPSTELAYITKAEKDLLLKKDIHGSLKDGPNKGPEGIMSLDSAGDKDGPVGGYSGADVSAAESGNTPSGMSQKQADEFRGGALSAGAGSRNTDTAAAKREAKQIRKNVIDRVNIEKSKNRFKFPSTMQLAKGPINKLMSKQLTQNRIDFLKSQYPELFDEEEGFTNLPGNLQDLYEKDKLYTDDALDTMMTLSGDDMNFADFMYNVKGSPGLKLAGNVGGLGVRSAVRDADGNIIGYKFDEKRGGGRDDSILPIAQQPVASIPEPTGYVNPLSLLTPRIAGTRFLGTKFEDEEDIESAANGGRIGAMGGGIMNTDVMGGLADGGMDESGRQMYFLGKLVKKATRAVKKITKSPFGKAALLYGLGAIGGSYGSTGKFFSKGMFSPGNIGRGLFGITAKGQAARGLPELAAKKGLFGKLGLTEGYGGLMPTFTGGMALASSLPFLFPGEEDNGNEEMAKYLASQRLNENAPLNRRILGTNFYAADGGMPSKEPVAKKTMPLLDMDGQEMDLRAEGGFVPLGRMERADDVPARLSKNEFVFTADAVRNAGEGDIDKGAEVMYNMMKNLESGGEVSEESQGLEGAREMFQTSQRLEEVI